MPVVMFSTVAVAPALPMVFSPSTLPVAVVAMAYGNKAAPAADRQQEHDDDRSDAIPLAMGLFGWCPPYALLGISSCKAGGCGTKTDASLAAGSSCCGKH